MRESDSDRRESASLRRKIQDNLCNRCRGSLTDRLTDLGWSVEGHRLFMADHYRAAVDMIVRWALSESNHCSVEIDDWFSSRTERQRLLETLDTGGSELSEVGK